MVTYHYITQIIKKQEAKSKSYIRGRLEYSRRPLEKTQG